MTKQEKYLYEEIVDRTQEIIALKDELLAVRLELIEANRQVEINKLINLARSKHLES